MELTEISGKLLGLSTIREPFTVAGLVFMCLLASIAFRVSLSQYVHRERIDRILFWAFGLALIAFAILRPIGLARDDITYGEILKSLCTGGGCYKDMPIERDYIWYGLVKLGLTLLPEPLLAALALSGIGVFIKLFVIDQLCHQRLLALLLLIPLSYIQYDLTQLRAGFACSWMMLGIYWVVRSQVWLGGAMLLSNFLVHAQAIFSPSLLAYRLLGRSRWIVPIVVMVLLGMIYGGVYPKPVVLGWLGLIEESSSYYSAMIAGRFSDVKLFPVGYILILGFGSWVCATVPDKHEKIGKIVSASLLLGTALAWFFVEITVMQMRLFEFYAIPLVLLAGNLENSKVKIAASGLVALLLYVRLELLNDWILG